MDQYKNAIDSAVEYLKSRKIPECYIPHTCDIERNQNSPFPPPKVIFKLIVDTAIANALNDIGSDLSSEDDSKDDSDEDD